MANPTKQLTVADLEAAKDRIKANAHDVESLIGSPLVVDMNIAATCIGIVEELVKSGNGCKYAEEHAAKLWEIHDRAVAAFGGEVK